jgi:hypothetical protein
MPAKARTHRHEQAPTWPLDKPLGREGPGPPKGAVMRAFLQNRAVRASGLVLALAVAWVAAGAPIWGTYPG